jgi:hypothetical protein
MEYGRHIMEAEFVRDNEYVAARRIRNEDSDQWQSRAIRAQEDLGEADNYAKSLEARIRELEKELACHHNYEDNRGGKRARYDSPYEGESGTNSPAPRRRDLQANCSHPSWMMRMVDGRYDKMLGLSNREDNDITEMSYMRVVCS